MRLSITPVPIEIRSESIERLNLNGPEREVMLIYSIASDHVWNVVSDKALICIFGLISRSLTEQSAYLWVHTIPNMDRYRFTFARHSREVLKEMLKHYLTITGHCDINNPSARRWLCWLGVEFHEPQGQLIPFTVTKNG